MPPAGSDADAVKSVPLSFYQRARNLLQNTACPPKAHIECSGRQHWDGLWVLYCGDEKASCGVGRLVRGGGERPRAASDGELSVVRFDEACGWACVVSAVQGSERGAAHADR